MNRNRIAFVVLAFGALFAILMLQQPAGLSAGGGPIEVNTPLDVDDDNQCDQVTCSLREAIDLANDTAGPNEIMVPAGIYTLTLKDPPEDANGSGDLDILDDLTINGAGPGNTVIEQDLVVIGQPFDRIFHLHGVSLTLNGVTLRQGREQDGGDGGGIYSEPNSDLHINDSTLTGLETDGSGGAIYAASPSSIVITDSLFESNIGMSGGGALFLEDGLDNTVLIENSVFNLNGAQNGGAMKIGVSDSLVINDSDFTNNEAMDQTPMCSPCLSRGGAIDAPAVHVQMTGGEISGNTSHHGGGGGMHASSATIDGTEITGNRTLGTKLDGYRGGGIRVVSDAIISNALIAGNEASGDGGGIFGGESTIITDSAISTNSASNGGGVSSIGDLQIYTSLIGGNEASDSGGGVLISEGTAHIENSTISANTAESGGAIYRADISARVPSGVAPPGPVELEFVTIAVNSAISGSAITDASVDELLTINNSIVAGNTGSPNCAVALISLGYNIEDGNSCGLGQAGDQPNTDPLLLALAENGGPTQTHALMTGSPAIDIADPACPPPGTDQRGISRPLDGDVDSTALCDIGAFEAPGEPPTPSPTPGVTPTPTPTPVPTPTPTGGPTPTPTPTPTEPPEADALWGDDDCNLTVAATDALKKLQDIAAIDYEVEPGCPALGDTVNVQPAGFGDLIWGDTDCDGDYDAVDALQILRSIAALPTNEEPECPEVGAEVVIA